jgi:hypothetical protein
MMRQVALVGVGGVLAALLVAAGRSASLHTQQSPTPAKDTTLPSALSPSAIAKLPGPRQPVFFRHDIHAGQYKIPCQYCHYTVAVSTEPGVPSMQTCMGCHLVISGTDSLAKAEIKKVRQAWSDKKPIEWVRVHTVAKHAHFPHMRHIKGLGANACQTCHGDVARMPQMFKVNNVNNMGFCITCHLDRRVIRDCSVCHY